MSQPCTLCPISDSAAAITAAMSAVKDSSRGVDIDASQPRIFGIINGVAITIFPPCLAHTIMFITIFVAASFAIVHVACFGKRYFFQGRCHLAVGQQRIPKCFIVLTLITRFSSR